ncbi:MAG: hypothetical protein UU64_C0018G0002 [candidate division WWE3 bacterium GW2011_GWF2_41_45]|nr:MAG: hypothetical protein UU64_C0018G0002 [candidate division WWE3 bacterium GW2011_GWF2_41_45]KKS54300.1 MAG: hypothetical protein UV21_C0011G0002 [candidate division WWE3 bacterium GW2011_GWD2_42_34]
MRRRCDGHEDRFVEADDGGLRSGGWGGVCAFWGGLDRLRDGDLSEDTGFLGAIIICHWGIV